MRLYSRTNTSRMYQRKLLGYERNFCSYPRHHKSNEMQREIIAAKGSRLTERKRNVVVASDVEPNDNKDKGETRHVDLNNMFSKKKQKLKQN